MDDLPKHAHIKSNNKLLQRTSGEHHLCMLCLRAIMRDDYGFRKIVNTERFLSQICLGIMVCTDRVTLSNLTFAFRTSKKRLGFLHFR